MLAGRLPPRSPLCCGKMFSCVCSKTQKKTWSLKLLMFTSSSAVTDINPALRMKSVGQTMTCLCVSGVPLTFRWYRMMPVLSRSSSMPMRWGSSESSTTPMPSFLRARVSSCRRVHTDHSLKPEQSSNKALTLVDQWLWNCRDCSKHAFLPWGYSESRSICWSTPSSAPEPAHTTEKPPSYHKPLQQIVHSSHAGGNIWLQTHSGFILVQLLLHTQSCGRVQESDLTTQTQTDRNTQSGFSVTFTL